MRPETAAFLDKARECLAKAGGMPDRWPDEAGREAYRASIPYDDLFKWPFVSCYSMARSLYIIGKALMMAVRDAG